MLRRILSPRQPLQAQESKASAKAGQFVDTKPRSQSSSAIQFNGHLGIGSDEGEEVKNSSYGDPDNFQQQPVRTQSMVTTPTREMNPPLPPRNVRPLSFKQGEAESESSVYVTPADTLRNRPPLGNSSQRPSAASGSVAAAGNMNSQGPAVAVDSAEALPTRSERKVMQMHQLTMNQRRGQGGGTATTPVTAVKPTNNGHQRTRSFGNVTENSDYSVPFDLKGSTRPPMKPPRVVPQARNEDCIIPINPPSSTSPQPPSDRSDTNSPSSPMSNQSAEHEPPRLDDGNSDYAVPWDRNKIFQNMHVHRSVRRAPQAKSFKNEDSGISEDSAGPSNRVQSDREAVQLPQVPVRNEEQKPPSGSIREYSPPTPARSGFRYQSAREPMMGQGPDVSPPPPDLPYDPYRPHRSRAVSDRIHRRDGSTSPVSGGNRGEDMRYHSQSTSYVGRNPPPPPSRLDPPMERGRGDSYPLPPLRDQSAREDLGRQSQVIIDVSIPLKDQP